MPLLSLNHVASDLLEAERVAVARLERQRILEDPSREFRLVMTEGALRWRAGSARMMAEQIDHLASLAAPQCAHRDHPLDG